MIIYARHTHVSVLNITGLKQASAKEKNLIFIKRNFIQFSSIFSLSMELQEDVLSSLITSQIL